MSDINIDRILSDFESKKKKESELKLKNKKETLDNLDEIKNLLHDNIRINNVLSECTKLSKEPNFVSDFFGMFWPIHYTLIWIVINYSIFSILDFKSKPLFIGLVLIEYITFYLLVTVRGYRKINLEITEFFQEYGESLKDNIPLLVQQKISNQKRIFNLLPDEFISHINSYNDDLYYLCVKDTYLGKYFKKSHFLKDDIVLKEVSYYENLYVANFEEWRREFNRTVTQIQSVLHKSKKKSEVEEKLHSERTLVG
ncbi:hypothetical protein CPJCM30710_13780 [Clostridium polyendosporum]|uniref:Uncharacterized protein n=1 Tax=Clostridium polyendosporum TaxID=69208 RepID=A0A919VG08_9CLOT|nr:hypothetical protein [Clostridium polyendosporum]GIM28712.1 hypothetical protein CPJCM30710_13780 [Clostridium polyendosporum]